MLATESTAFYPVVSAAARTLSEGEGSVAVSVVKTLVLGKY